MGARVANDHHYYKMSCVTNKVKVSHDSQNECIIKSKTLGDYDFSLLRTDVEIGCNLFFCRHFFRVHCVMAMAC